MVDVDLVLVFGFVGVAFDGGGEAARRAVGDPEVLVVVGALLEHDGGFVGTLGFVVDGFVGGGEVVVGEVAREVELAACAVGHIETEVHEEVVGLNVGIVGQVVAHEVAAVVVGIEAVVAALEVGDEGGMEVGFEIGDLVDSLRGVVHVDDLEAAVLVAAGEDELRVVGVLDAACGEVGGLEGADEVVGAAVLIDVGLDLGGGVGDFAGVVADGKRYLLMAVVGVDVGVAGDGGGEGHAGLDDAEAGDGYGRGLSPTLFIQIDLYAVVARDLELYVVVGEVEAVVGVEHGGVEGVFVVLDGLVVEAVHVVDLKEVGGGPVGIAVHNAVDEAVVVVREVVEGDAYPVIGTEGDDIVEQPVVVDYGLQGMNHGVIYLVALRMGDAIRYE